ncbi:hypothetical protein [Spirillospora sp. NPDC029432]|uniref:hypothetical protein n=1 Tax=Spirillospora sp. NPDC029432 TaxID=3154599 RepID=UPI0034569020
MPNFRVSALALSLTTAGVLGLTATIPANAAAARPYAAAIVVTPDGFTAPASVPAGATAFRVGATDPDGAYIGVVRLRPGVSKERYLADLERAYDDTDREGALAGARAVERDVVMHGGAAVLPGTPVTFTAALAPGGRHLVIDFKDVGSPGLAAKVRELRVLPRGARPALPPAEAEIVQVRTADGPRFRAPRTVRAGAPVRVANRSRQFNEAILMPVRPGTTRQDVGAFFVAMEGGPQAPAPFTGGPVGMVPLSPGRSAVLAADLRPGTYALVTWLTDYRTGRMHAAQGMHEIVTVE